MTDPAIRCDACELTFTPELREEPGEDGGVTGLFDCPHCSTTYESYVVDAEGLRLRERLAVARSDKHRRHVRAQIKTHVTRGRGMLVA